MANPQAENGHIDIANEVAEQLCRINLSPYESRALWVIWRKTYGWHKKDDRISYTQFEEMTNLNRWHIARTLKRLIMRNIITSRGNKRDIKYGFQKDYSKWVSLPVEATKGIITYRGNTSLPVEATKSLPVEVNTKEKKETIQKKIVSRSGGRIPRLSNHPLIAQMQEHLGFPSEIHKDPVPNPAKEARFIKKMESRGFTEEEIFALWKDKVDKRGEFVSMVYVNEDIGKRSIDGRTGKARQKPSDRVPKDREYTDPEDL